MTSIIHPWFKVCTVLVQTFFSLKSYFGPHFPRSKVAYVVRLPPDVATLLSF
jgi:hypothetical protein